MISIMRFAPKKDDLPFGRQIYIPSFKEIY